jgi:hypothetical protein
MFLSGGCRVALPHILFRLAHRRPSDTYNLLLLVLRWASSITILKELATKFVLFFYKIFCARQYGPVIILLIHIYYTQEI